MPRPTKSRRVEFFPKDTYFIPWKKLKCEKKVDEVLLKLEELEAMRLKDIEGLNQEACAGRMQISRQTFQIIIDSARKKVAEALTEGKAIQITGGHYTTNECIFKCMDCGIIYEVNFEQNKYNCPQCGSEQVVCRKKADFCQKWCERHSNKK